MKEGTLLAIVIPSATVLGMALAANIESFYLLIGKDLTKALTGNNAEGKRTLEEILASEQRIREFIERKRAELAGSDEPVPVKP